MAEQLRKIIIDLIEASCRPHHTDWWKWGVDEWSFLHITSCEVSFSGVATNKERLGQINLYDDRVKLIELRDHGYELSIDIALGDPDLLDRVKKWLNRV